MSQRFVLLTWVLGLSLCAQENLRRPSPFPEKNRERELAATSEKTASRPARFTRRVRVKPSGEHSPAVSLTPNPTSGTAPATTGRASFFTSAADGALTASGGRLDAGELVAAHATYPLGSLVKVTNLANGKTVEVQIVDRFPDPRRIINLSEAAARQLGFIKAGTAEVRVEPAAGMPARPIGTEPRAVPDAGPSAPGSGPKVDSQN